jgi:glycosyltransferase involved in cell wall biosynthesis
MLKLGYFTHTNISPSETFIFDLIKAFNDECSIDLKIYSGKINQQIKGIEKLKTISTGYSEYGYRHSFRLYKLGQVIGGKGSLLKTRHQQKSAYKALAKNIDKKIIPDVAYIEYGTSAVLCYKYLIEKKVPFIVHVHGFDVTSEINNPIYLEELRKVFVNAVAIITPSNHLKRLVTLLGCNQDKIHSIYPVTRLNEIRPLAWNKRVELQPSITFLGRLTPKKNPIALLYALKLVTKEYPHIILHVIGDGPLMIEVKQTISILSLVDNVILHGSQNRIYAFRLLNTSWVYAQHSVTANNGDQEGFPVSLAEAAAHALPLVSTIHSGITENIIHGETGFLVQEHDYEDMAAKLIYLIKNPKIAEKMGEAGRIHISKICHPNSRYNKIIEFLQNATNNVKI